MYDIHFEGIECGGVGGIGETYNLFFFHYIKLDLCHDHTSQ